VAIPDQSRSEAQTFYDHFWIIECLSRLLNAINTGDFAVSIRTYSDRAVAVLSPGAGLWEYIERVVAVIGV